MNFYYTKYDQNKICENTWKTLMNNSNLDKSNLTAFCYESVKNNVPKSFKGCPALIIIKDEIELYGVKEIINYIDNITKKVNREPANKGSISSPSKMTSCSVKDNKNKYNGEEPPTASVSSTKIKADDVNKRLDEMLKERDNVFVNNTNNNNTFQFNNKQSNDKTGMMPPGCGIKTKK